MDWSKLLTKDNAITAGEIIGGFIPGISETIDVKDIIRGVKNKNFAQVGIALAGLTLPAVSGAHIKAAVKGGDFISTLLKSSKDGEAVLKRLYKAGAISDTGELIKFTDKEAKILNTSRKANKNVIQEIGNPKLANQLETSLAEFNKKFRIQKGRSEIKSLFGTNVFDTSENAIRVSKQFPENVIYHNSPDPQFQFVEKYKNGVVEDLIDKNTFLNIYKK